MDWDRVIERNGQALRRILAMLVAMAGLGASTSPLAGEDGKARQGEAEPLAEPGEGAFLANRPHPEVRAAGEPRRTLPRHLHRAIVRLLRPAESAARRLIIVIARDLVVPPPRPVKPTKMQELAKHHAAMRRLGLAVVVPAALAARMMAKQRAAKRPRALSLPLLDPLPNLFRRRRKTVPNHAMPRILSLDRGATFRPLPPPPSPNDPVDATRLALRLDALGRALDDLPRQAMRFARWRAAHAAARARPPDPHAGSRPQPPSRRRSRFARVSPLRPGPAHGWRRPNSRRKPHEIDEVLADLHYFAFHALQRRDTS